jgi:hypothetical protein
MFPPHNQNTGGVCNQTNRLNLYYISSGLVTFLKVTDAPLQVSGIFDLTFTFKFMNFSFQIFLLFFMKCLLSSRLTLFIDYLHCFVLDSATTAFKNRENYTKPWFMLLQFIQI